MENATKALMIAAAVLVSVLVITLGINIFNSASEQVDNAGNLSEYETESFNSKFTKYEGTDVTGSEVNALLTTVFTHNNSQEDVSRCVKVTGASSVKASNAIKSSPTKVATGKSYTVKATYNTKTGLITSIKITEN